MLFDFTQYEMPFARKVKAGNSIAHHHARPPATPVKSNTMEMITNPIPDTIDLTPSAYNSCGSFDRCFRASHLESWIGCIGSIMPNPVVWRAGWASASVTLPRSMPQLRQNLPLSGFWVPHFGQNIK